VRTKLCIGILALSALLQAQEPAASKIPPCLVVARYGTEGPFFYRDQYGVPVDHLQLAYSGDDLNLVLKGPIRIDVVYSSGDGALLGVGYFQGGYNAHPPATLTPIFPVPRLNVTRLRRLLSCLQLCPRRSSCELLLTLSA
jgi:hypothetical protein